MSEQSFNPNLFGAKPRKKEDDEKMKTQKKYVAKCSLCKQWLKCSAWMNPVLAQNCKVKVEC